MSTKMVSNLNDHRITNIACFLKGGDLWDLILWMLELFTVTRWWFQHTWKTIWIINGIGLYNWFPKFWHERTEIKPHYWHTSYMGALSTFSLQNCLKLHWHLLAAYPVLWWAPPWEVHSPGAKDWDTSAFLLEQDAVPWLVAKDSFRSFKMSNVQNPYDIPFCWLVGS